MAATNRSRRSASALEREAGTQAASANPSGLLAGDGPVPPPAIPARAPPPPNVPTTRDNTGAGAAAAGATGGPRRGGGAPGRARPRDGVARARRGSAGAP